MKSNEVYEAAQRVCAVHGWSVTEVDNCEIWAGLPRLVAMLNEAAGRVTAGISNPRDGKIGIDRRLKPDTKPQVLLHEMAHCLLNHKADRTGEESPEQIDREEIGFEEEAETTCKLAIEMLGLPFTIDRGLVMDNPSSKVIEAATQLAQEVYAHMR